MLAVPVVAPAVNVTEHDPAFKVQVLVGLNVPVAVPVTLKVTVPVGVLVVPGELSATVAVQLEFPFTLIEVGTH